MRTLGLVMVLFGPDEAAYANLAHASAGCSKVVVVDNSPVPDRSRHALLRAQGMTVVVNGNVGGLAGAYNRGIGVLLDQGCDLCFLLDQDSEIRDGFFDRMAHAADSIIEAAYLIGPRVYEVKMDRHFPASAPEWGDPPTGVRATPVLISSGSAVSAEAFRAVGDFREDLFIEAVDVEYSLRAARAGVGRYVNLDEELRQYQGAMTKHGRLFTTNHVAWRRYYLVRNLTWVGTRYLSRLPAVLGGVRVALREAVVVMLFEQDKGRKLAAIGVGALDGFRAKLGTFEQRWPRMHRWCTAQRG